MLINSVRLVYIHSYYDYGKSAIRKSRLRGTCFLNYSLKQTRGIGRDKIDVKAAPDIVCRFDKERENKMADRVIAAMYSLRD